MDDELVQLVKSQGNTGEREWTIHTVLSAVPDGWAKWGGVWIQIERPNTGMQCGFPEDQPLPMPTFKMRRVDL